LISSIEVAANKETTETRIPSGYVEVITTMTWLTAT